MYLGEIQIENFRQFKSVNLIFQQGVNLLVGGNDSGKSSIIDAIKLVTGTHSNDWIKLTKDDFYTDGTTRASELKIVCIFYDLNSEQAASFLEWLSINDGKYYLKLTLTGRRKEKSNSLSEIFYDVRAGEDEESGIISGAAKNLLKVTYLKPLRDAEYELAPRKGSRLSQILAAYEIFQKQEGVKHPLEITMDKANQEVTDYFENKQGKQVSDTINLSFLKEFSLSNNPLTSKFGIAQNDLGRILEKLELQGFSKTNGTNLGLGSNNLLFIATEMLLLKKDSGYIGLKLSLIEEIEAHLHPQSQLNLIDFLEKQSKNIGFQSIITTHSNSLASKVDINNLILCRNSKAYSLRKDETELSSGDYEFLRRFLDNTKANLFFANGVIIVEGDAENLIIPTLAEYIGYPLHKHGTSIVNVGSTALLRYAKIFQRKNGTGIGIKVSCITDRDIPPKEAKEFTYEIKRRKTGVIENISLLSDNRKTEDEYSKKEIDEIVLKKKNKYSGGDVQVFIPNTWTLEYEIARSCLREIIHQSILIALETNNFEKELTGEIWKEIKEKHKKDIERWKIEDKSDIEIAVEIYAPLERKLTSKAVVAQVFSGILNKSKVDVKEILEDPHLKYLVDAIKYVTNDRSKTIKNH
ncbi:AAA family ATPase [Myroides odoratimimus]|uniref:ATP-dependent nuclease n=1 Tax=Myroides odoratimimus TaxID=76832 RepID=UPI002577E3FF|nr:AAA family ATPase [Myroides odoratimimus]MDM1442768.1 AAA family ATPase [Myroides odoratimimus]